jgi:methyl-accepting chemotaxis protein
LRNRFLLLSLLLTALFALALLIWLPGFIEEQLSDELVRRAQLGAEVLDKSALGALTVGDRGALNQLAHGFIRSRDFLYILILDKDHKILADSGLERKDAAALEKHLPEILKSDTDAQTETRWPSTGEKVINVSRPVFYEQLRIGTIALGISARRVSLEMGILRRQLALLCGVVFIVATGLAWYLSRSLSLPLLRIAGGLETQPDAQLEKMAGKVKEFNLLVEVLVKQKNLFKASLGELESTKLQLEADLSRSREESSDLNLRLDLMTKQIERLQEKVRNTEEQSKHLIHILPLVQFATGVAPEINASMQHISQSAERLNEGLVRVRNLIDLYEKALPQTPEDLEVIRQYKSFIHYDKIREDMEELITTIRGGASWTEQLVDLLKQLSTGHLTPTK